MKLKQLVPALVMASLLLLPVTSLQAADHLDAPLLGSTSTGSAPGMGPRDINDLYAFQSPNPGNTVLIMTVNPFAPQDASFATDVVYDFNIDNDGDQIADVTLSTTFGAGQAYTTTRNGVPYTAGVSNSGLAVAGPNGVTSAAGRYEDPFFFDLAGFQRFLGGTGGFDGTDAFAGADITAIVLEVPSSDLIGADANIAVWATTSVGGAQMDRMGRPAINTALIPSGRKDAFNQGAPADDVANFDGDMRGVLTALGADPNLAATLLPDVLTFETGNSAGFLNGRRLEDDVIDGALSLVLGTAVSDMVDANDAAFPGVFPYLATANVPEPSTLALALLAFPTVGSCLRRRRSRV